MGSAGREGLLWQIGLTGGIETGSVYFCSSCLAVGEAKAYLMPLTEKSRWNSVFGLLVSGLAIARQSDTFLIIEDECGSPLITRAGTVDISLVILLCLEAWTALVVVALVVVGRFLD